MAFFRAISRFFSAIFYFFAGKTDRQSEKLEEDADAAKAKYLDEIRKLESARDEAVRAVAITEGNLTQMQLRLDKMDKENDGIEGNIAQLTAKLKRLVATLKGDGKGTEEIKADQTYKQYMTFLTKFKKQDEEIDAQRDDLRAQVEQYGTKIERDTDKIKGFNDQIKEHKREANELYAELKMATADDALDDAMGAMDGSAAADSAIAKLQETRNRVKARRSVKNRISGKDETDAEAAFLNELNADNVAASLEADLGLFDDDEPPAEEPTKKDALPE